MKQVKVVAAAILSECGQKVFLAKRPDDSHQGGLWEFPGGKKEPHETALEALCRELQEEIAIEMKVSRPLIKLSHDYGDKQVELDVYCVTEFSGNPTGAEGQQTQWVDISELEHYRFPAANQAIIERLTAEYTC